MDRNGVDAAQQQQAFKVCILSSSALFSAMAAAIAPEFRWMMAYSLVAGTVAFALMRARSNRSIFAATYCVLLLAAFVMAYFFPGRNTVNRTGVLVLMPFIIAGACVAYRIFRVEGEAR